MNDILTCVLCGRRGTHDYVMVTADPERPQDGHQARCRNRPACQRRIDTANADARTTEVTAGQPVTATGNGHAPAGGFASAGSVAGLAREVEAVRRAVEPLRMLPAQVEDLARVVGDLAEEVTTSSGGSKTAPPASWLVASANVQTVHETLTGLTSWLTEVYLRYQDAAKQLPECWLWHPDVVEELLCLMTTWHTAYRGPKAAASLAGDWHDRLRPGVVRRMKTVAGSCSLENHQPRPGHTLPGGPAVPLADALAPIADWWALHRRNPAPEPTEEQITGQARRGERR